MPHVAEGDLHAYLDGALEALDREHAERVREHVEGCPTCAERLAEAEAVRASAHEILGLAGPADVSVPPFEDVRRMAGARDARAGAAAGGLALRAHLAWAATVVISLGVGWGVGAWPPDPGTAAGPLTRGEPSPSAMPVPADELEESAATGRTGSDEESFAGADAVMQITIEPGTSTETSGEGAGGASRSDPAEARDVASREARTVGTPDAGAAAQDTRPPTEAAAAGPPARDALGRTDVASTAVGAPGLVQAKSPELDRRLAPERARPAALEQEPLARAREVVADLLVDAPVPVVDLAVPGFDVTSVAWTELAPGVQGVRLTQRLADGRALEVRFLARPQGEGASEGSASDRLAAVLDAPVPEGWSRVWSERASGYVVLLGPLSETELRELLGR